MPQAKLTGLPAYHEVLGLEFLEVPVDLGNGRLTLGRDGYGAIILIGDSGEVFAEDPDSSEADRFMNSSLGALAAAISSYDRYSEAVVDLPEPEALRLVSTLEADLRSADPRALCSPINWWSIILESAREGQL